ncbi:H/ACA ribonucleoprotein complex subunit GAR1-like [Mustela erminea]|uniref:H/ACA ribonucleoprotein complex subunit GAR1-like n=1 Tax=Mustela erminea TaxID=36723 RepID=UPI001386B7DF|nr:H/ACA ribonucleoprotein complex subunit GAR1-like [Mustela erminea]
MTVQTWTSEAKTTVGIPKVTGCGSPIVFLPPQRSDLGASADFPGPGTFLRGWGLRAGPPMALRPKHPTHRASRTKEEGTARGRQKRRRSAPGHRGAPAASTGPLGRGGQGRGGEGGLRGQRRRPHRFRDWNASSRPGPRDPKIATARRVLSPSPLGGASPPL